MAERVGKDDFTEKVLDFTGLSVVEFYTDSCVPCKRMSPILADLGERYAEGVHITKVNAAFEPELAEEYEIAATPTFLFFKNGEIVERFTGARKKEELEELIKANR
ncbi:MAG: thioredoxin family protein [Bacteroides sp.]|nr:thioredoxin family protein [Eubacterium sp.]MCM1418208.1 thioredoxin family protein [Roseburia sp.]MCM1462759.1 thioredoxin family protein [Bacteroides sp.]